MPIPPEDLAPGDVPHALATWPDGTLWCRVRRADGGPDRIAKRAPEPDAKTVVYGSLRAAVEAEEEAIKANGTLQGFWTVSDDGRIVIGADSFAFDAVTDGPAWRSAAVDSAYAAGERRYESRVLVDERGDSWVPYADRRDCPRPDGCRSEGVHAFSSEGELVGALALSPLVEASAYGIPAVRLVGVASPGDVADDPDTELTSDERRIAIEAALERGIEPDGTSRGTHQAGGAADRSSARLNASAVAAASAAGTWAVGRTAAYALPLNGSPIPLFFPFLGPPPRGATARLRNGGYQTICLVNPFGQLQVFTWVEVQAHDHVDHRLYLNTLTPFGWSVPEDLTYSVFRGDSRFERITAAAYSSAGSLWIGTASGRVAAKIAGEWSGLYGPGNSPLPGTSIQGLDVGFDNTVYVAVGDRVLAITDSETGPPMFFDRREPRSVVASSALSTWPVERLVDGDQTAWSSSSHNDHLEGAEWAALHFDTARTIRALRIIPRGDPADAAASLGFPKAFVIQLSSDTTSSTCDPEDPRFTNPSNWRPLITRSGFPQPSDAAVRFDVEAISAKCVRILGTELSQDDFGNRYLQLNEFQALGESDTVYPADVTVSSAIDGWPANRLVDGSSATTWSSQIHREHLKSAEWAAVVLQLPQAIDAVRILPRQDPSNPEWSLGFPKDFVIQYSVNGSGRSCNPRDERFVRDDNWRPLITRSGFPQPSSSALTFPISRVTAGCVRLFGAELSPDDYGNRYMQLAELQALVGEDPVVIAETAVSSALGSWPAQRLADGRPGTVWSSRFHDEHLASAEWAAFVLTSPAQVDSLRVHPRPDPADKTGSLGFPQDLIVQYASDGAGLTCDPDDPRFGLAGNWRPLITRYGVPQPTAAAIRFAFPARTMGCVRFLGAELSQDDFGLRYFQLAELEVLLRLDVGP